jgi:uncharacterized spore protein YtfJ
MGASTIYATPLERDGMTVIPVAAARFWIGVGSGADPSKRQEGEGGGGAARSRRSATSSSRATAPGSFPSFTPAGYSR